MRMCTKCDAETASTIGFSGEELCSTCYADIPLHIRKMDIGEAKSEAVMVRVFIKDGGQQVIGLPASLFVGLAISIRKNGSEKVQLGSGESIIVTGILVTGKDFYEDGRMILVEGKEE